MGSPIVTQDTEVGSFVLFIFGLTEPLLAFQLQHVPDCSWSS
jgi:hypothetical protein